MLYAAAIVVGIALSIAALLLVIYSGLGWLNRRSR